MKRTPINKTNILKGYVFTTKKGGRYYLQNNPTGLMRIMNDVNKTVIGYVQRIDSVKIEAINCFLGTDVKAELYISDCFLIQKIDEVQESVSQTNNRTPKKGSLQR